jgi:hypothetical protein
MELFKVNRKKLLAIIGGIVVLCLLIVLLSVRSNQSNGDGKEAEQGGPSVVQVSGDAKLNAFLTADQFTAVKDNISTYILNKYGDSSRSATIQSTSIAPNGVITLHITIRNIAFTATVTPTQGQTIFAVPATGYSVTNDVSGDSND